MDRFMQIALQEARKGMEAGEGGPFGAVIVKNSEVVSTGHNMVIKTNDPTAHAEIVAIRRASQKLGTFRLEGCTIYVTAKPWARMQKVVYCNTEEETAAIGFDDSLIADIAAGRVEDPVEFEHRPSPECRELFMRWFEDPNKVLY